MFFGDPITTVQVIDNNSHIDFTGGNYSYLVGTVPAGSQVNLTNPGSFTFTGFPFAVEPPLPNRCRSPAPTFT